MSKQSELEKQVKHFRRASEKEGLPYTQAKLRWNRAEVDIIVRK